MDMSAAEATRLIARYREEMPILCLMTVARAGSKLCHSLFDGHPDILCFPRKLHFGRFWSGLGSGNVTVDAMLDRFFELYPHFFSSMEWYKINKYERAEELGERQNEGFELDKGRFRSEVKLLLTDVEVDRATVFLAFHFAYQVVCNKPISENPVIFCHIHDANLESELHACRADFSNIRVLVTTRNPLQSLESAVNWMEMHNKTAPWVLYYYYRAVTIDACNLARRFRDVEIRVCPVETLHKRSREVMERICEWADIRWHENLLRSTMHGKLWWGNGRKPRNGFNLNWNDYPPVYATGLRHNDWCVMRAICGKRLHAYGYLDDQDLKRLRTRLFVFRAMLPTASESQVLARIMNPFFWGRTFRAAAIDARDERLRGYDYYTKKRNDRTPFIAKFVRSVLFLAARANPVSWSVNFCKRVDFSLKTYLKGELPDSVPPLLMDMDAAAIDD